MKKNEFMSLFIPHYIEDLRVALNNEIAEVGMISIEDLEVCTTNELEILFQLVHRHGILGLDHYYAYKERETERIKLESELPEHYLFNPTMINCGMYPFVRQADI